MCQNECCMLYEAGGLCWSRAGRTRALFVCASHGINVDLQWSNHYNCIEEGYPSQVDRWIGQTLASTNLQYAFIHIKYNWDSPRSERDIGRKIDSYVTKFNYMRMLSLVICSDFFILSSRLTRVIFKLRVRLDDRCQLGCASTFFFWTYWEILDA